ncbi:adenosylcobinamide-GDP ribazoletransferase [Rhodococcus sp. 15-725-2-2b]|uniref:adenosylcobinamide-GDP ribazoletransferase n=1 Tax=unclassified Rhodococcus (in: high G+C Gram-positive bacteria) TaxID=192944 RepID=UPI000B9ABBDE|nr:MULTISPECIES: adenosylcobinamide-GDP ribazoletransferase [unclassified Rhodococcus (in: high G+C Gram-positive bacteria)]OZC64289.1 adenosylcobinamide-GDP ribazoletransferase [Rhodococcus sp. 06-470-2]OZC64859.1 adenosylcobinamide-GDP ribazoletransferase [Rhodococcus sp. 06-469-3-2]OZD46639.1 adenosylcobinamide-GDP ribazoletransferase [Rhodococcus sp. 06-1477-1A]OZE56828.1 adenosylcobinamide-GDP ribazoletransferase [Rhodococcus sp. 05-2221-1B]OZE71357.1 adenosylcobinamide-GDP ribazoletransf
MSRRADGVLLAFSWLTVLPVRGPEDVDRHSAGRAIAFAPLVGLALGGISAALLWVSIAAGLSPLLGGLIAVGASALLTRGMHLDGLADTADGLGCYGPPERAREVMKSGSAGPFGVAALVLVLGIQAASLGQLAQLHMWWAIVCVSVIARVSAVVACRRGIDAATPSGFGALVAGTQSTAVVALWTGVATAMFTYILPDRPWQGALVVIAALAVAVILTRHCVRRFGGLSGDVLGAGIETTTALAAVGLLLGS